jgi:type IV pilus assembly protein PilM
MGGGTARNHKFVIVRQKCDRQTARQPVFVSDSAGKGGTGLAQRRAPTVKSFSFFKKGRSVVGLDIGSSAVKAVELKVAGKGYRVAAFGTEPVPPDSIVDGAIIDSTAVAEAIRRLFDSKAFKTKDVAASLSGNAVIVKKISLPVMTATELDESIYWEAEQYIPFDIQDVNLDYQILEAGKGEDAKGTMEVLLVAAKKEKIADYTGVIAQAGRTPVVVDVDAFALQNAYELNYGFEAGTVVVLLNAGASAININIVANEQSVFTRDVSLGGNAYTEAVQRELNLPFDSAEQLKKGMPVDGATFEDVIPVLRAMTENVLLEVQKTFDFFKATASTDRIDRIMLSGGASRVEGFAEALQERFGTPVEMFDPFRRVILDAKMFSAEQRESIAPTAAVAVGLALRRAGDR